MKIVLVSAVPPPEGGIATWTLKYIDYCKTKNIEIELVNTALQGGRGKQINTRKNFFDEIKRTYFVLSSMRFAVRKSEIDIVHINSSCSQFGIIRDYLCGVIAKKRRIPVVLHCHCNIEDQIRNKIGLFFFRKIANLSSAVLVLNKKSHIFFFFLGRIRNVIIPNFIEDKYIVQNHKIRDEIREVVFVGHVQKTKGCVEIINAAEKLPNIHFTLVGPVNEEISQMSLVKNISLVGAVASSEVEHFLQKADLYLFPSYTEGFSLSLTEAMANGLPCIATDVGANRDMLEENGGVIIEAKDADAIVDAVNYLKDYEKRKEISKWNINKVRKNYLMENVMKNIIEVYEEVQ